MQRIVDDWTSVGGSFPIARGVKPTCPGRPVISASGDMGIMCNFGDLAKVFGAYGERVTEPGELASAIQRALASGKPALIDVMIDQNTLAPVVFKQ